MQSLALYPPYGTPHVVGAISELIQWSRLRAGLRHRRDLCERDRYDIFHGGGVYVSSVLS